MIKRFINFRIKAEADPSGVNDCYFILEVQHQFIFKYWVAHTVDRHLEVLMKEVRKLKRKNGDT